VSAHHVPAFAENLLSRYLPPGSRDSILGDFSEVFEQIATNRGIFAAKAWYWAETIRTLPGFWLYSLEISTLRRQTVTGTFFSRERGWVGILSLFLLLPALLLVIPGLLFEVFGKPVEAGINSVPGLTMLRAWLTAPWLVLGGVGIALLINLLAILQVDFKTSKDNLQATLIWKRSTINFWMISFAVMLFLSLIGYGIAENLLPLL